MFSRKATIVEPRRNWTREVVIGAFLAFCLALALLVTNFLVINAPILIESESSGGLAAEFPDVMLMPDRTLYRTYIDHHNLAVMRSKISEDLFNKILGAIETSRNQVEAHYVISGSYDDVDINVYFRNPLGEYTTYIYGYATDVDPERAQNLKHIRETLLRVADPGLVEILDQLPELRREPRAAGNNIDFLVVSFWRQKQTKTWIGEIRKDSKN